jgi:hypothetical protein
VSLKRDKTTYFYHSRVIERSFLSRLSDILNLLKLFAVLAIRRFYAKVEGVIYKTTLARLFFGNL